MCLFKTPDAKDPQMPTEYAQAKAPTRQDAAGAGAKTADRLRAGAATILTGGGGVGSGVDMTGKKTLLGA